jgi:hypothetical protein
VRVRVQHQFAALVMSVGLVLLGGAVPEATLGLLPGSVCWSSCC